MALRKIIVLSRNKEMIRLLKQKISYSNVELIFINEMNEFDEIFYNSTGNTTIENNAMSELIFYVPKIKEILFAKGTPLAEGDKIISFANGIFVNAYPNLLGAYTNFYDLNARFSKDLFDIIIGSEDKRVSHRMAVGVYTKKEKMDGSYKIELLSEEGKMKDSYDENSTFSNMFIPNVNTLEIKMINALYY